MPVLTVSEGLEMWKELGEPLHAPVSAQQFYIKGIAEDIPINDWFKLMTDYFRQPRLFMLAYEGCRFGMLPNVLCQYPDGSR